MLNGRLINLKKTYTREIRCDCIFEYDFVANSNYQKKCECLPLVNL